MTSRVRVPTIVVIIPIVLDFVHPASAISVESATIPIKKVPPPMILNKLKSSLSIVKGYPSVVIISIFVIENIEMRKQLAAKVDVINKEFERRLLVLETTRLAINEIEKPAKRALIKVY